jgi:hypothetical protein
MLPLAPPPSRAATCSYYDQAMDNLLSWTTGTCSCVVLPGNNDYRTTTREQGDEEEEEGQMMGHQRRTRDLMMMDKLLTFVQFSVRSEEEKYNEDDEDDDDDDDDHDNDNVFYEAQDSDSEYGDEIQPRACGTIHVRKATPWSKKKCSHFILPEPLDALNRRLHSQPKTPSSQQSTAVSSSKPDIEKPPSSPSISSSPAEFEINLQVPSRHYQQDKEEEGEQQPQDLDHEENPLVSPAVTNESSWFDFSSWLLRDLPLPSQNRRTMMALGGIHTPSSWAAPATVQPQHIAGSRRLGRVNLLGQARARSMDMGDEEEDDDSSTTSVASTATTVTMNTASFANSVYSEDKDSQPPPQQTNEKNGHQEEQPIQARLLQHQHPTNVELEGQDEEEEYDVKSIDENKYPLFAGGKNCTRELGPNDLEFEGFHLPLRPEDHPKQQQQQEETCQEAHRHKQDSTPSILLTPTILRTRATSLTMDIPTTTTTTTTQERGNHSTRSEHRTRVEFVRVCSI